MNKYLQVLKKQSIFWICIFVGVLIRIICFGLVPGGLNQDEAYAGYEAYNILKYGQDSFGYSFPVYLTAWGSGMNALESYLMIPFLLFFGLKQWVIRLPQVVVACISLFVFYKLLQEMFNDTTAKIGLFVMAVCPWHIMMSRWALESNLAPGFMLFGFYFFYKGISTNHSTESKINNQKYLLLSALFYGLCLYCYATVWEMLPVVLLLQVGYLLLTKQIKFDRYFAGFIVILGMLALPLVLFLLVNYGFINEIVTPFISIPRLVSMRSDDISILNIGSNLKTFLRMLLLQDDGYIHSTVKGFGIYYYISVPFLCIGLFCCVKKIFQSKFKDKAFVLLICYLIGSLLTACLISVNVNRINFVHIWNLILIVLGILWFRDWIVSEKSKKVYIITIITIYSISFLLFAFSYFNSYKRTMNEEFKAGLGETILYGNEHAKVLFLEDEILHPVVLFYTKENPKQYRETVAYSNYPSEFLDVVSFEHYIFHVEEIREDVAGAYIMKLEDVPKEILDRHEHYIREQYVCVVVKGE